MDIQQRRPQRGGDQQPFDQRFLLFALASMAMLMLMNSFFAPLPVDPGQAAEREVAAADAEAEPDLPPAPPVAAEVEAEAFDEPPAAAERVALGSVDPDGAYRMLVTIDNVGAAVERIELSSDDYRDLDDRSGYLGQLALTDAPEGGALVNVVGPGTPAAEAGLAAGDVIVGVSSKRSSESAIANARDLLLVIDASRPGDTLSFDLKRGDENTTAEVKLRRQPLDLIRPEIENVRLHTPSVGNDFVSTRSFLLRLTSVGGRNASDTAVAEANRRLAEEAWTVDERTADGVTLRMRLAGLGVEVLKRFELVETPDAELENKAHPSYHFDLSVEVRNLLEQPQAVAYELSGPNGLPIEGFWYANKIGRGDGSFFGDWGSFGLRDVIVRYANDRLTQFASKSVAEGDVPPMGQGRPLAFAGVDSQYFASIVMPLKDSLTEVRTAEVRAELATEKLPERKHDRWQNASIVVERTAATLGAAGGDTAAINDGWRVFAGPKLPELLQAYAASDDPQHTLGDVLYYGWFGWAARPMLWLMHTFYAVLGNYGLAIIMLTVCVRGAMFPISRQTAMNMVKMQQLKPELDRIAERYKEDMQKRAQAQQELFRKHNYNPAAGCLPMFIQLPVFMGLYRALAVDVELRQAPLISDAIRFCSNLAAPDMAIDWSAYTPLWMDNGEGMMGLGPYFNLLPLATCGLMLAQQKMFMPEATTEQAKMQQQMMKYMMVFMGFIFFKVPSGLCIYFIASSLWGIAERKMLPRPTAPTEATPAPVTPASTIVKSKPSGNGAAAAKRKAKKAKGKKRR